MSKSLKFAFIFSTLTLAMVLSIGCGDDDGGGVIPGTPDSGITLPGADAAVESCDTVTQDCEAETDKCSVNVEVPATGAVWSTTCRPITGSLELGAMCMRDPSVGNPGVGKDNCAEGLYCTARGNPDGDVTPEARVCRRFCQSTAGCTGGGANFTCMQLTTNLTPATGICIDSCAPLGTGTCVEGAWCTPQSDIQGMTKGECTEAGTAEVNTECAGTITCGANLICVTSTMGETMTNVCRAVCDLAATPAFPCAMGETCSPIGGFPADYGVCTPNV